MKKELKVLLGKDLKGNDIHIDFLKRPNLIISGIDSSGKSTMMHNAIVDLASKSNPDELELYIIQGTKAYDYSNISNCKENVVLSGLTLEEQLKRISLIVCGICEVIIDRSMLVNVDDVVACDFPQMQLWLYDFINLSGEYDDKSISKEIALINNKLEFISRSGKFVNCFVINVSDSASKDNISREVKGNTFNWVSFKQKDCIESNIAIGADDAAYLNDNSFLLVNGKNVVKGMINANEVF